jgi:hypothetical protein
MFPSVLNTFSYPTPTSRLNNPSHSGVENAQNSVLGQIEAIIGLDYSGSVLGTIIGDLRSPASSGGGHVQSANKGGTGQTTFSKGDILVASSSSVLSKLAIGTDGMIPVADSTQSSGLRYATQASILSFNTVNAATQITGILPVVNGGTGTSTGPRSGLTTKNLADSSRTQNIAHGLGKVPTKVKILAQYTGSATQAFDQSTVVFDSSGTHCNYICIGSGGTSAYGTTTVFYLLHTDTSFQSGVITVDGTNIIITWTNASVTSIVFNLLWEVE